MLKHLWIVLIFPILLHAQEQVTDIQYFGVNEPTALSGKAGFAFIDGQHYFLQDHDSLVISKFENGSLTGYAVIPKPEKKIKSHRILVPNRSLFEIRDGKYYRFFINSVQVIDIKEGIETFHYDFEKDGFVTMVPNAIHDDNLYFRGNRYNQVSNYSLNTKTGVLSSVHLPSGREYTTYLLQYIPGVEAGKKLYLYDALQNKENLVYESQSGLQLSTFNGGDSTLAFVENTGELSIIDHLLNITYTGCTLQKATDLKAFRLEGKKLIAVFYNPDGPLQDIIKVFDIESCNEVLSFITETRQNYANNLRFNFNENNDTRFTIFGYFGENPTDGFSQGLYYVIDHEKNRFTPINNLSQIVSYTPFVFEDAVYCIGVDGSFWGSRNYILKHDLSNSQSKKLFPEGQNITNHAVLGYLLENQIVTAANTIQETPALWKLKREEEFLPIQSIDFRINLGVHVIDKIFPLTDRLYFNNKAGIYSVLNEGRPELLFNNPPLIMGFGTGNLPVTTYNNLIAFCEFSGNRTIFKVLDTSNGKLDSLALNENYAGGAIVPAGPFIFFSKGNNNSELQYFDLRNKAIKSYSWLPWMIDNNMFRGKKRAVYLERLTFGWLNAVHLIDYETDFLDDLSIDFNRQVEIIPGYDDSFYFIDQGIGSENSRIRVLRKDGTLSTIYNGEGNYYTSLNYRRDEKSPVTIINLIHKNQTSVFVVDNAEMTESLSLPHTHSVNTTPNILANFGDKFIIRTRESDGFHFWFYRAFSEPEKIEEPNNKTLLFSGVTDSLALLLFRSNDSSLTLIKYDHKNRLIQVIENPESECDFLWAVNQSITIDDSRFLLSAYCYEGSEPWILDAENNKFTLLSDINPGIASGNPSNFIRYKDWIYFTSNIKDNSRQWFRYLLDSPSSVVEPIPIKSKSLTVYPSPASDMIHFDQDFEEINFYNAQGQSVQVARKYIAGQSIQFGHLDIGIYLFMALDHQNKLHTGKVIVVR